MSNFILSHKYGIAKDWFDTEVEGQIQLLDKEYANAVWDLMIDPRQDHYMKLPEDAWPHASKQTLVGNYKFADKNKISKFLIRTVKWEEETAIYFFYNRDFILETVWKIFVKVWDDFVAIENEGSILMKAGSKKQEAMIFGPTGGIYKMG